MFNTFLTSEHLRQYALNVALSKQVDEMAIAAGFAKHYRFRSAVTGRFVKAGYAKRYPSLTVRERV